LLSYFCSGRAFYICLQSRGFPYYTVTKLPRIFYTYSASCWLWCWSTLVEHLNSRDWLFKLQPDTGLNFSSSIVSS
jgi:hypothetical protein